MLLPYSRKIWRGIKFGALADRPTDRQIKYPPIFNTRIYDMPSRIIMGVVDLGQAHERELIIDLSCFLTQARRKHIFFGQAKFDRHDHAYSVIQRSANIQLTRICVHRRLRMLTLTIALYVSIQLVTPPFSHKYWSGQNRTNRTGCAGPALTCMLGGVRFYYYLPCRCIDSSPKLACHRECHR